MGAAPRARDEGTAMRLRHKRLVFVAIGVGLLAAAAGLMLKAFEENIVFFFSPTEIVEKAPTADRRLRIGGLVEEGSVKRATGAALVTFRVTDGNRAVAVTYQGILPDLFREGQGVVAEGRLVDGVFRADEVLAKHDENYMPREVVDALKATGHWQQAPDPDE